MENNTKTTFNRLKQMYVLNLISNLNANFPAVNESELDKNIRRIDSCLGEETVSNLLGGRWNVVWGPATGNTLYTSPDKTNEINRWVTDNAMYVAQSPDKKEYFVGISGTNGISLKGWFEQDFDVEESVEWPPECAKPISTTAKNARISKASNEGIKALWKLEPSADAKASGTLINFLLNEVKDQTCSISVGGHSLGGCLTPLIAAAISDKMDKANNEKYAKVKINAYPTAGPTPGNQAFANHLQAKLNEYHAVYNQHDLVPLSWDFKNLDQLTDTYESWKFGSEKIKPNSPIARQFLHWASNYSKKQNYNRLPSNPSTNFKVTTWKNDLIPGITLNGSMIDGFLLELGIVAAADKIIKSPANTQLIRLSKTGDHKTNVKEFIRFLMQVLVQHVPAYNATASSTGETPWTITETENKALQPYFKHIKSAEGHETATKEWGTQTAYELLRRLAKLAADWLQKHPSSKENEALTETMSFENEAETTKTTEEISAGKDQLLAEFPELVDTLMFFGNPYM